MWGSSHLVGAVKRVRMVASPVHLTMQHIQLVGCSTVARGVRAVEHALLYHLNKFIAHFGDPVSDRVKRHRSAERVNDNETAGVVN